MNSSVPFPAHNPRHGGGGYTDGVKIFGVRQQSGHPHFMLRRDRGFSHGSGQRSRHRAKADHTVGWEIRPPADGHGRVMVHEHIRAARHFRKSGEVEIK